MSAFTAAKVDRLIDEGRVAIVHSARVVAVMGDHGTYSVTVFATGAATCVRSDGVACPSGGSCSHRDAARRLVGWERAA